MFKYNVQQKCFSGEKVLELSVSPSSRAWKIYSYLWCCLSCRLLVWFVLKDWVVLDAEKAYEKYPSDLLCIGLYCTVSVTIQHFVLRGYDFILLLYWFFFIFVSFKNSLCFKIDSFTSFSLACWISYSSRVSPASLLLLFLCTFYVGL